MKRIEIKGANYFGKYDHTRKACRAVIIDNGNILLSYETKKDQWMLPGGGLEIGETDEECAIREIAEETGNIFKPDKFVLQIDEYYEDTKYTTKYFIGSIIGKTEMHLTAGEIKDGLKPRWISVEQATRIFSKHNEIISPEEKRGLYQREYIALKEILSK